MAKLTASRPASTGWLTTSDVARMHHAGLSTVIAWIRAGRLPATRVGRLYRVRAADARVFVPPLEQAHRP